MTLVPKVDMVVLLDAVMLLSSSESAVTIEAGVRPFVSAFRAQLHTIFKLMDDSLSEQKPWFSGGKFGLADFNISWGVDMASQRGYLDLDEYSKLGDWNARAKARGGYQRALEKSNGYDLKTFGLDANDGAAATAEQT
ncbi:hypothetical protein F4778DRAFT_759121 [Xylariomycetidae sp. FL2044]|nr:hypothetical protein F4778DRAFT_759121 [Xylariomycetidae sp. FL2044]